MNMVQERENLKKKRWKHQILLNLDSFIIKIYMNYFYLKKDV